MRIAVAALLLLAAGAPAAAQSASKAEKSSSARAETAKKPSDFDLAKMMAMFDKVFPPQPDPAPERLALARVTAGGMLPSGLYASMFDEIMSGMVDRVLAMKPSDLDPKASAKSGDPATLRQAIAKDDPYFNERERIFRRVISEELLKLSAVMEPKIREGLARSMARRFDDRQLTDINTFLATPSGKAFAGQSMRMWVDPDVLRSMVQALPHMITAMPGAFARLEAETAHLPKPKKKSEAKDEGAAKE